MCFAIHNNFMHILATGIIHKPIASPPLSQVLVIDVELKKAFKEELISSSAKRGYKRNCYHHTHTNRGSDRGQTPITCNFCKVASCKKHSHKCLYHVCNNCFGALPPEIKYKLNIWINNFGNLIAELTSAPLFQHIEPELSTASLWFGINS